MNDTRVSSARAAEIVGIGYEGFRSYLKRGLLGRTGMLPGFHRPGAATHDDPVPRSGWLKFGIADLCLMRCAKMLMDNGMSFASANSLVSQHGLWMRVSAAQAPFEYFLLSWPPFDDYQVFEAEKLRDLPDRLRTLKDVGTLVNVGQIWREVAEALEAGSAAA